MMCWCGMEHGGLHLVSSVTGMCVAAETLAATPLGAGMGARGRKLTMFACWCAWGIRGRHKHTVHNQWLIQTGALIAGVAAAVLDRWRLLWHNLPTPTADDVPHVPATQEHGHLRATCVWLQVAPQRVSQQGWEPAAAGTPGPRSAAAETAGQRHSSSSGSSSRGKPWE